MSAEPIRVTIEIEMGALIALLDTESALADIPTAQVYGLLTKKNTLTPMGGLVLLASDQTFLRHKIVAGARSAPVLPTEEAEE